MKYLLLISILFIALLSCNNRPVTQQPAPETPEALQEKKSGGIDLGISKRGYDADLLESLYEELVDKTPELKNLEDRLDHLYEAKLDSVKAFNNFDQKNDSYYRSANTHADRISDSLLRDKIKLVISSSESKYKAQTERHNSLIALLDARSVQLADLHIVLKLVKTLAMMEKYQKDNIPSTKPIERVIREFDKTIQKADSLSKK